MDIDTTPTALRFEALQNELRETLPNYVAEALLMVMRALFVASDKLAELDAVKGRRPSARRRDIAEKVIADFRVAVGSLAVAEIVTTPTEAPAVEPSGNTLRREVATVDTTTAGNATTGRSDVEELMHVWNAHNARSTWLDVIRKGGNEAVARRVLDELPEVTALDALRANAQLVELMTGRRWYVMRDAREEGASWADVGEALGMSKQGAQDFYRRKVAKQEQYVGDLHDTARARAALDEPAPRPTPGEHDAYYRDQAAKAPYVDPQVGDLVLVMLDKFRDEDGQYAAANVVEVDVVPPGEAIIEQPAHIGRGGRARVQLISLALISRGDR